MRIERLDEGHDVADFRCGDRGLDRYLSRFALPNAQEGYGVTYVAVEDAVVRGYYTLSNSRVEARLLPPKEVEGLPRYPMPSVLLGKLAVRREAQGRGLGRILLLDAFERFLTVSRLSGARLFEVDALDESAKAFYRKRGFKELADDPLHLFLTRVEVARILELDA